MKSSPDAPPLLSPVAVEVTRLHLLLIPLLLLLATIASATPPLQPGVITPIPFPNLSSNAVVFCTALPDPIPVTADPDSKKPGFIARILLPGDTPAGRVVLLAHDPQAGFSAPMLSLVEPLPTLPDARTNTRPSAAQPLTVPVSIHGLLAPAQTRFYSIDLSLHQTCTVESVARRIGSRVDPQLRILDPAGSQVALIDDSPGADRDALIEFTAARSGRHLIELTDASPETGSAAPFHLRIHTGAAERLPLLPMAEGWPAGFNSDAAFTQISTITNPTPRILPIPARIAGSFTIPGQPVVWQFEGDPAHPFHLSLFSRSLGFGSDLAVRILDSDGALLAHLDSTGPEDGLIGVQPKRTGVHRVEVRELSRQAGFRFGFECRVAPGPVGFTLGVDKNLIEVPVEKGAEVRLTLNRRDWAGPIQLHLDGAPGFRLEPSRIEGKGRDHTVRILAPTNLTGIRLQRTRLIGSAETTNQPSSAVAGTRNPALGQWPTLHQPPGAWDGMLLLGSKSPAAPPADGP